MMLVWLWLLDNFVLIRYFFTDSSIKKMLGLLEVELKKVREKEKKIYAGMFDRPPQKE